MSNPDCRGCGITAADLPDGFMLDELFEDDLCPGCQQLPEGHLPSAWVAEGWEVLEAPGE